MAPWEARAVSQVFADVLVSASPHPDIPPDARIFEPFIGSWNLVVRWHGADGGVTREERAEWHFARILEGRGIQDVWITPPVVERAGRSDLYEYGTSVRFYDARTGVWQSTWIGPMQSVVRTFAARKVGDRVVLETAGDVEPRLRWSFSDVAPRSFRWTNEVHEAGVWRMQQTFEATRATPA
jgi:hypothetical protein